MKHRSAKLVLGLIAGLFMFCFDNGNPAGTDSGFVMYPESATRMSSTYQKTGNTIIVWSGPQIETSNQCNGDSLTRDADTTEAYSDTMEIEVVGDILRLFLADTISGGEFVLPWIDSSLVVTMCLECVRSGVGTGLVGSWQPSTYGYRILAGSPTPEEKAFLDSLFAGIADEGEDWGFASITFDGTSIASSSPNTPANDFVEAWSKSGPQSDSAKYDVLVARISGATVMLTGSLSGEKVVISWNGVGDKTYSSSDSAHAVHTYFRNPVSCPNISSPAWYQEFLTANLRVGAKVGTIQSVEPFVRENHSIPGNHFNCIFRKQGLFPLFGRRTRETK